MPSIHHRLDRFSYIHTLHKHDPVLLIHAVTHKWIEIVDGIYAAGNAAISVTNGFYLSPGIPSFNAIVQSYRRHIRKLEGESDIVALAKFQSVKSLTYQIMKMSQTIKAPPAQPASSKISSRLALGAGCYWGTEKYVRKDFQKLFPGSIQKAVVGFMSPLDKPPMAHPSYDDVTTGQTTYIEVLYVELKNPAKHFEELIRFFFRMHDPTTRNRQGNDVGTQYASHIFCGDAEQVAIANRVTKELQELVTARSVTAYAQAFVTTKTTPLHPFVEAHKEHQRYLEKNPNGYCNHRIRFPEWPALPMDSEF